MKKNPQLIPLLNFFAETLRTIDFARRRAYDWRAALLAERRPEVAALVKALGGRK